MASLRVVEIFASLQGEGCWTGVPMTFVRLAGCNAPELHLGCTRWCDTRDSWAPEAGEELDVGEVVRRVGLPRLCLTGGEPLLQVEGLGALVAEAHRRGIRVHVETNGTVDPLPLLGAPEHGGGFDWATVSPKPPDYFVAAGWEGRVDELKLIADQNLDAATAERLAAAHPGAVVCIQPVWAEAAAGATSEAECGRSADAAQEAGRRQTLAGRESIDRAVALVLQHPEWRLSLQTHKLLGIR
jgi:7-carboxy-7-deazaguanine synthase